MEQQAEDRVAVFEQRLFRYERRTVGRRRRAQRRAVVEQGADEIQVPASNGRLEHGGVVVFDRCAVGGQQVCHFHGDCESDIPSPQAFGRFESLSVAMVAIGR